MTGSPRPWCGRSSDHALSRKALDHTLSSTDLSTGQWYHNKGQLHSSSVLGANMTPCDQLATNLAGNTRYFQNNWKNDRFNTCLTFLLNIVFISPTSYISR